MDYQSTIDFLYGSMPAFERQGAEGYKPGLERVLELSRLFGDPHKSFPSIHIAGTNGKGSTAHLLASILQCAGYKTGLFTSPHLLDFTERIRINGKETDHRSVVDFVARFQKMTATVEPSFFELTTVMAFDIFVSANVDIAVVETGLGGRLDSTNILNPLLSVITNVDYDHTDLLGDTLEKIAREKAGIIKPERPVVVSEAQGGVKDVFLAMAKAAQSPIVFADCQNEILCANAQAGEYDTATFGKLYGALTGTCQLANARGVLEAVKMLREMGYTIPLQAVSDGFKLVTELTGLRGRWTEIALTNGHRLIYDTGHNPAGWRYTVSRLKNLPGRIHVIIGFVADKDVESILKLLADNMPSDTPYYITQPQSHRALNYETLADMARANKMKVVGEYADIEEAMIKAKEDAAVSDTLFVGGSNYLIGNLLSSRFLQAHSWEELSRPLPSERGTAL